MAYLRRTSSALMAAAILSSLGQLVRCVPVRAASPVSGGATRALYGGLHPFGGLALNKTGAPYWNGIDIARAVSLREDGSGGWILDGYGGIHAFGSAAPIKTPGYWNGWAIARAFVVTSRDANGVLDGRQGYLLDGYGGLWPWGGAPALSAPYVGRDVARGLEIHYDANARPDGGWSMDWRGRVTAFGAAQPLPSSGLPPAPIFRQLHGSANGGYVVARWGVVTTYGAGVSPYWSGYYDWGVMDAFGAARPITSPGYWPNWYIARAMVMTSRDGDGQLDGRQGYLMDGWGCLHSWGGAPALVGNPYTPYQDLARGLEIHFAPNGAPDGGWEMDRSGKVTAFGAAPALAIPGVPAGPVMQQLHATAGGGFALAKWGSITTYGSIS